MHTVWFTKLIFTINHLEYFITDYQNGCSADVPTGCRGRTGVVVVCGHRGSAEVSWQSLYTHRCSAQPGKFKAGRQNELVHERNLIQTLYFLVVSSVLGCLFTCFESTIDTKTTLIKNIDTFILTSTWRSHILPMCLKNNLSSSSLGCFSQDVPG